LQAVKVKGQELHLTNLFDHVGKEREQEEEEMEDLRNAFLYPAFRLEERSMKEIAAWKIERLRRH
jgi:hypothetical protein